MNYGENPGKEAMTHETKQTSYNGWSNYETWSVYGWLTENQDIYHTISEMITSAEDRYGAYEALKNYVMDNNPLGGDASLYSDLLHKAIGEIGWHEIIDAFSEK